MKFCVHTCSRLQHLSYLYAFSVILSNYSICSAFGDGTATPAPGAGQILGPVSGVLTLTFYDPITLQPYLLQDLPEPFLFEFPTPPQETFTNGTSITYDTLKPLAEALWPCGGFVIGGGVSQVLTKVPPAGSICDQAAVYSCGYFSMFHPYTRTLLMCTCDLWVSVACVCRMHLLRVLLLLCVMCGPYVYVWVRACVR